MISLVSMNSLIYICDRNLENFLVFATFFKRVEKIKELVHPKMKSLSLITHPHVVPNHTFVHQDIFDEIQELSDPA